MTWNNLALEGLVCRTGYYLYQTILNWIVSELLERVYLTLLRIFSYCHRITGWKCRTNLTNYCLPGKVSARKGEFWVSGFDLGMTGHYVWMTTGESLDDIVLDPGSINIEMRCIRMVANETAISYYNYPCYATLPYICEIQEDNVDIRK